jgi:hypothetical protein
MDMLARNEKVNITRGIFVAGMGWIFPDVAGYKPSFNDNDLNPYPRASKEHPVIIRKRDDDEKKYPIGSSTAYVEDRTALSSVACRVRVQELRLGAVVPLPQTPTFLTPERFRQEGIGLGAAQTPAQFRAIYEKWAADPTTPEDDSDILPTNRAPSETPRLAHLAETHKSLLYWARLNRINNPLATSWMEPAQPDEPGDDDKPYRAPKVSNDCTHEMRPTENELLAIFSVEELESGPIPTAGGGGVFRGVVGDIVFGARNERPESRSRARCAPYRDWAPSCSGPNTLKTGAAAAAL